MVATHVGSLRRVLAPDGRQIFLLGGAVAGLVLNIRGRSPGGRRGDLHSFFRVGGTRTRRIAGTWARRGGRTTGGSRLGEPHIRRPLAVLGASAGKGWWGPCDLHGSPPCRASLDNHDAADRPSRLDSGASVVAPFREGRDSGVPRRDAVGVDRVTRHGTIGLRRRSRRRRAARGIGRSRRLIELT